MLLLDGWLMLRPQRCGFPLRVADPWQAVACPRGLAYLDHAAGFGDPEGGAPQADAAYLMSMKFIELN